MIPGAAPEVSTRPHVVWLGHFLPFPINTGGSLRSFHMIRELAQTFRVTVLTFYRSNHHGSQSEANAAAAAMVHAIGEADLRVETPLHPVPTDRSRAHWLAAHLRSALTGQPVGLAQLKDAAFDRAFGKLLATARPDLIHIDSIDLVDFVADVTGIPVVCNFHDVDSAALERRATAVKNPLVRWYVRAQARSYARLQREAGARFALNLVCSEREASLLRATTPAARISVVENGVDTEGVSPLSADLAEPDHLVFVGPLFFHPNRQGIDWFVHECWPRIRAARPGATFTIVGKATAEQRAALNAVEGIEAVGLVDDVKAYLARARCVVVPLLTGGGTRLKILEAWSAGRPVVSTAVGCEGLEADDSENILIRDGADEFSRAVVRVLEDSRLAARLAAAGRHTAEAHYGWSSIGRKLRELFENEVRANR